jgi:hypothetical protein
MNLRTTGSGVAGVCLALLTVTAAGCNRGVASEQARDPWRDVKSGWTKLPSPPVSRTDAATVWTGSDLLLFGGCPESARECTATKQGYEFDPLTGIWRGMPPAPRAGVSPTRGVWTGGEAIFLDYGAPGTGARVTGQAFDPSSRTWRMLPPAPIPAASRAKYRDGTTVWTGSELIVWGGGAPRGPGPRAGAAYDPATNRWRRIADAPIGLNLASGVWTGDEMLVFGSLLDGRNYATTRTSIGAAYDPTRDLWRRLPPSRLSPQATSAVMSGERVLAWDYEERSQEFDPDTNRWDPPKPMGFDFAECYPQSAVIPGHVIGACWHAFLYHTATASWRRIDDGPLAPEVRAGHDLAWQPVAVASAGSVAVLDLRRIDYVGGVPCSGCPRSPQSFWAYRPQT